MLLSNCVICDCKTLKFLKQREASGLLSSLGIKTPLSKIPFVLIVINKLIQGMK